MITSAARPYACGRVAGMPILYRRQGERITMTENFTASESKASYSFTLGEFRCLAISDGHYPYGLDDFFTQGL